MRNFSLFIFLIALLLGPGISQAEYRVFLLKISKTSAPAESPDFRLVESTLDPQQYREYYPIALDEQVTYTQTWRCYGRTDWFKPHCPNPKGQIPAVAPATP